MKISLCVFVQAISENGFAFKIKAEKNFKTEAYSRLSRIRNFTPRRISGRKVFLIWIATLAVMISLCGCSGSMAPNCQPVLFPYVEYGYHASQKNLAGSYKHTGDKEKVELFGLKIHVPEGWQFESITTESVKFSADDGHFFAFIYQKDKAVSPELSNEELYLIGCDHFELPKTFSEKSSKEFFTDLYFLTDDQLHGKPTFWQSFILWAKTTYLQDAIKLVHHKGNNLEAFQTNLDPAKICNQTPSATRIEIFPEKISPHYVTIAGNFSDDAFFMDFLDMLDILN